MEIYLVRHGIAAVKRTYAEDSQRPLTEKGINKTTKVAKRLLGVVRESSLSSQDIGKAFVFGSINDKFILKKAGIIGIKISDKTEPIGNSELFMLASPKWFIQ